MKEIWKHYKTQRTDIEISNFGNIRGTKYDNKPFTSDMIIYHANRKHLGSKSNPVYRLVWKVFNGPIPKGYDIHHKDHNKFNDRLDNLELIEHAVHTIHHNTGRKWNETMYEKQRMSQKGKHCGELNPMYGKTHTKETIEKIRKKNKGKKMSEKSKLLMSKQRIGRHWYNNGTKEMFCFECPEGFIKGRISMSETTKNKISLSQKGKLKTRRTISMPLQYSTQ